MNREPGRRIVDWSHILLLAIFAIVVVAYLLDARSVSLKTNNLLLVQPASIIALVLVAIVLRQCFRRTPADEAERAVNPAAGWRGLVGPGLLAVLFGAFTLSLQTVGFDVATFVFITAGLWVCGERRLWVVLPFSAVFTAVVVYGYQSIIPYPFPLSVL